MKQITITQNTTAEIEIEARGDWTTNIVKFTVGKNSSQGKIALRVFAVASMIFNSETNKTRFTILMLPENNKDFYQWRYWWNLKTDNSITDKTLIREGELIVRNTVLVDATTEEIINYINNQEECEMDLTRKVNSGSVIVGTTAVRLPDNVDAKWVQLMHEHESATVYIGGSDLTLANGFGALKKADTTEKYPVQNTNVFYAVADAANVTLRFMWGEY